MLKDKVTVSEICSNAWPTYTDALLFAKIMETINTTARKHRRDCQWLPLDGYTVIKHLILLLGIFQWSPMDVYTGIRHQIALGIFLIGIDLCDCLTDHKFGALTASTASHFGAPPEQEHSLMSERVFTALPQPMLRHSSKPPSKLDKDKSKGVSFAMPQAGLGDRIRKLQTNSRHLA